MAVWKLTDSKCKAAKPSSSIYKLFDGEGLYLAVTPSGGKHWRISYRVGNKAQTHCLGPLERIALKDARKQLEIFLKVKSLKKSNPLELFMFQLLRNMPTCIGASNKIFNLKL